MSSLLVQYIQYLLLSTPILFSFCLRHTQHIRAPPLACSLRSQLALFPLIRLCRSARPRSSASPLGSLRSPRFASLGIHTLSQTLCTLSALCSFLPSCTILSCYSAPTIFMLFSLSCCHALLSCTILLLSLLASLVAPRSLTLFARVYFIMLLHTFTTRFARRSRSCS